VAERVVVTGVGVVTPIGPDLASFADALRAGRSGVRRITAFDCDGFDTQIAAQVGPEFDPAAYAEPPKAAKLMSRAAALAVAAAAMARADAGLGPDDVAGERLGVSLGAGGMGPVDVDMVEGQLETAGEVARQRGVGTLSVPAFARVFKARTNPITMLRGLPNIAAAHVAIQHGARGPNATITTACTAGTQAIADAVRMIRQGDADVVLAGGADAMINPVGVLGFGMLGTLSRRNDDPPHASRPFDRERDGFVIGEGAGVVVLERESFARARAARTWAELAGYGVTCDAYRITDERPDATSAAAAILRCLEDAGASAADVDYVNAHGTGTPMNDVVETRAIKAALGARAGQVPVSSTKSMIGHLLAAAGAVELAATLLALRDGFLPPTINYRTPDPECDLDYVPNVARPARVDVAISNSFGFGGQNACLAIRRL
jgi:3-oxoacyl-[acyl-carrier-protein] synthase II